VFPLALIGFVVVQFWLGEDATSEFSVASMPLRYCA
jgi:hypothetical protein